MSRSISAKERNEALVMQAVEDWFNGGRTYGPSYRDLVELSGLPLGTVHKTCRFLRDDNKIEFDDNIARSMRIKKRKRK
jgi:hypothetical protein